jgi:hypothetical protein
VISGLWRRQISEKAMWNDPAYRAKMMKQRSEKKRRNCAPVAAAPALAPAAADSEALEEDAAGDAQGTTFWFGIHNSKYDFRLFYSNCVLGGLDYGAELAEIGITGVFDTL